MALGYQNGSYMIRTLIYSIILFAFSPKNLFAQEKQYLYQLNRLVIDSNYIFSYGRKNINHTNRNRSVDGFEHNANFCFARYNQKGKKQWEVIVNKNRSFIQNSKLVKHGSSYCALLEFMTRKVEAGIFFNTLYFISFDSLGNVVAERKIKDSIFYGFNHVYFDNQFIYVTLRTNQLVCEKYDYNFNLVETITNPLVASFFYDVPNDDAQINNSIVNVGPRVDVEEINAQTKINAPVLYQTQQERFIKRIDKKMDKTSKVSLIPLPKEKGVTLLSQTNVIYFLIQDLYEEPSKIYKYDEKLNKLHLIIDTLRDKRFSISYFYALNDQEFILYRWGGAFDNNRLWYPDILCYIKNGKVVSRSELKKIDSEHFLSDFKVVNNKLYIYETNTFGGDIVIKVWDYHTGEFEL